MKPNNQNGPEAKAVRFLEREVPAWHKENACFSCHNNGDGARALYFAMVEGYPVSGDALAETTLWLRKPSRWKENKGDPNFSDKNLANLQFASALLAAVQAGAAELEPLDKAAQLLVAQQSSDGAWRNDADAVLGSPVTYGTPMATQMAISVLEHSNQSAAAEAAKKGRAWLTQAPIREVPSAAAIALIAARQPECITFLRRAQTSEGGWGPYPDAPAEVFDTALAVLGLTSVDDRAEIAELLRKGREYLIRSQQPDGSWPATTRPTGGESYAQRISTTAWAAIALITTRDLRDLEGNL